MTDTHRQFTRLKTNLTARLRFRDGRTLDCGIRDFCQNGMNLQALDPALADRMMSWKDQADTPAELEFRVPDGEISSPFRVAGKLLHGSSSGIGFYTDSLSPDAYQALIRSRAGLVSAGNAPAGLLHEEAQAILQDCASLFRAFLEQAWRDLLTTTQISVNKGDAAPLPLAEHSRYLNALADLLRRSGEMQRRHHSLLVERMERLERGLHETERKDRVDELAILDEERFEDWLHMAAVFNRLESDVRSAMFHFHQRFSRLMPIPVDKSNDPFGPEAVCLAFQEATRDLDLSNPMRGMLYKQLGKVLAAKYPRLYEQLNQLLAPLRPLPNQPVLRPSGPGAPTPPGTDVAGQVTRLAEIAERLFSLYPPVQSPGTVTPVDAPGHTGPPGMVPAPPAYALPDDPRASRQLLEQTLHLLARRVSHPEPSAAGGQMDDEPAAHATTIGLDDLLTPFASGPDKGQDISLSHRLAATLERSPDLGRLPQGQRNTLTLATRLLGRAMADHAARSDIDALLRKLERPLYELAMAGVDILGQADHPLHRLFNLVDRFAVAADDDGRFLDQDLHAAVAAVIDGIAQRTGDGAGRYAEACAALERLLRHPANARAQKVLGHQELCESQERLRAARARVAAALEQRMGGRIVPAVLVRLLDEGWRQYLLQLDLRDQQARWNHALAMLEDLVAGPDRWRDSGQQTLRTLVDDIGVCLRGVSLNQEGLATLLEALQTGLSAGEAGVDTVHVPPGWFSAPLDEEVPDARAMEGEPVRPGLGEWWDFGPEGARVPMQLIWMNASASSCAFVNRSATRKTELRMAEFRRRLAAGEVARGENRDLPLLERSEYGIVDAVHRQLAYQAGHDPVTGLLNRRGLLRAVEQHLRPASGQPGKALICLIEFDPVRMIYDNCGVEAGDALCRTLADSLRSVFGQAAHLARLGEGAYALLLPGMEAGAGRRIAGRLLEQVAEYRFTHGEASYRIDAHVGMANLKPHDVEGGDALRNATAACNAGRARGANTVEVYEDSGLALRDEESLLDWAGRIDGMLAGDGLYLRCQRIQPIRDDPELRAYHEVLLGIRPGTGNDEGPQAFIHAVEHWNRSRDVDIWVIRQIFGWIRANPAAFAAAGGFSINLSARSLSDAEILGLLRRELEKGDLHADRLMFEITETATLQSYGAAQDFIRRLSGFGCKFCLDDFGSGNATYAYLRNLRTDTLKIDGSYVREMDSRADDFTMVKSMNDIGHSLGMRTVAEFVTTPAILALLGEIGVDYAQGYAIHEPTPLDALLISGAFPARGSIQAA